MDPVTGFATLFTGSTEGYGTEEGGCDKDTSLSYYERIVQHLEGDRPMGVYPLVCHEPTTELGWKVHWGCVDFDEGEVESLGHARNVEAVVRHATNAQAWIERSRSKGYHVWLFLDGWYPAVLVREALLGACQVVDAPTKEINPKSIALAQGQLGNYVRLPYPGAYDDGKRFPSHKRTMVVPTAPMISTPFTVFVDEALKHRATHADLVALRALYEPPKRIVPAMPVAPEGDIYKRMGGLAWTIYKDGPLDDMGRGKTLFKMACLLAEDGQHTQQEALYLCIEADQRWGKFKDRPNGEATIEGIVRKAYGS
jgi:hypothetical protein